MFKQLFHIVDEIGRSIFGPDDDEDVVPSLEPIIDYGAKHIKHAENSCKRNRYGEAMAYLEIISPTNEHYDHALMMMADIARVKGNNSRAAYYYSLVTKQQYALQAQIGRQLMQAEDLRIHANTRTKKIESVKEFCQILVPDALPKWQGYRFYKLGLAYKATHDHQPALECFGRVPPGHRLFIDAQFEMGHAYLTFKRTIQTLNTALVCFQQVPEKHRHYDQSLMEQANIHRALGQNMEAAECYSHVPTKSRLKEKATIGQKLMMAEYSRIKADTADKREQAILEFSTIAIPPQYKNFIGFRDFKLAAAYLANGQPELADEHFNKNPFPNEEGKQFSTVHRIARQKEIVQRQLQSHSSSIV